MPDRIQLNRAIVEAFEPTEKGYEVADLTARGLYLRILPSGTKAWSFRYSLGGRSARVSLGTWPGMTVPQARDRVYELRDQIKKGKDPASAVLAAKGQVDTMKDLAAKFCLKHGPKLKPSTLRTYEMLLRIHILPAIGRIRVKDLELVHVARLHDKQAATPRTANQSLAVVSKMLSLAETWGLRPSNSNPCGAVERFREERRHRYLTGPELARIGKALTKAEAEQRYQPHVIAAIRLLILTGMRVGELLAMRWEHLDEKTGRQQLPEHKTDARGERTVHLPPEAVVLLKTIPQHKLSPFIFAGAGKDGTIGSTLSHAWQDVREQAKCEDVRLHDLRHTFASEGIARGLTLAAIGLLLGHSTPVTTHRYAHLVADKAAADVAKIGGALSTAMKG